MLIVDYANGVWGDSISSPVQLPVLKLLDVNEVTVSAWSVIRWSLHLCVQAGLWPAAIASSGWTVNAGPHSCSVSSGHITSCMCHMAPLGGSPLHPQSRSMETYPVHTALRTRAGSLKTQTRGLLAHWKRVVLVVLCFYVANTGSPQGLGFVYRYTD